MTDFLGVTLTGTTYRMRRGILRIESARRGLSVFLPVRMATFDRTAVDAGTSAEFWEYVRSLPDAEVPVVGLSLYARGFQEWRLSTPMVSVEIGEQDD